MSFFSVEEAKSGRLWSDVFNAWVDGGLDGVLIFALGMTTAIPRSLSMTTFRREKLIRLTSEVEWWRDEE